MIDKIQLGWMAGVLDMKGRVRTVITPFRSKPIQVCMVESSNFAIVRRLSDLTGTRPEYNRSRTINSLARRGCTEHCPEPHVHVSPTLPAVGRWHITGVGAAIVLHNLLPYLTGDRAEREDFIKEIVSNAPLAGRGRHAINLTITRLAGLGWEIPANVQTTEAVAA